MQFTITEDEMQRVLDAGKPVLYLLGAGGVPPMSPQENVNRAWRAIGRAHDVEWMSIRPVNEAQRLMSGTPLSADCETETKS